jgi:cytochrome oxidase Cu insertion factor (SCO1/SenC/PrrC family)
MLTRRIALFVVIVAVLALGATGPVAALEVGDKAPTFTLPATTQEKFSLGDLIGKKNIVLFGFIGAFTPT